MMFIYRKIKAMKVLLNLGLPKLNPKTKIRIEIVKFLNNSDLTTKTIHDRVPTFKIWQC